MRRRNCGAERVRALAMAAMAFSIPEVARAAWLPETVRIAQLALSYAEHRVAMQRVEIAWQPDQPIALSVDRLDGPAGTVPLWASLRLRQTAAGWGLTGVMASGAGDVVLRLEGSGLGGDAARLQVRSEPLRFAPDDLQPARLWPPLGAFASDVRGTLRLELTWPDGPAWLDVEALYLTTDYGPIGPVDGRITLDRLTPPRTATPQTLRIEGMGLAPLVDGFEIAALGAEGTIDADLRFSFLEDGRLFIDDSVVTARGPGVLRYRADRPPDVLAGQGQGVDLLFTALADFRYESLRATLRGYLDDELTVELQLRGANPELYEGHPIELNVNLEAPILPLALAGRDAMELPEAVRRALDLGASELGSE
jgi:hypothetical protein